MSFEPIIPTHNGLIRIKSFTIEEIFKVIRKEPKKNYWQDGEYKIKVARAKVFYKKGLTCMNCGVKGNFFALEQDKGGGLHLDLYGYNDDEEILITLDHIIPKSKGGLDKNINYQIMCKVCNEIKADDLEY
jgi:5-methylcytosine-specific restriction endonuclease McrA